MAQLNVGATPSKPVREKREDALARLLYMVCRDLVPDDLNSFGEKATLAMDLISEAAFWLDAVPLGAKVHPSSPELRLGMKEWSQHHASVSLTADGKVIEKTDGVARLVGTVPLENPPKAPPKK